MGFSVTYELMISVRHPMTISTSLLSAKFFRDNLKIILSFLSEGVKRIKRHRRGRPREWPKLANHEVKGLTA